MPEAGRLRDHQVENHRRAYTLVLFLRKAELGFFHCLEIVAGWLVLSADQKTPVQPGLVPSSGQKILVQPSWYLRAQKIPLAENRFLLTGKVRELKIQGKNLGSALHYCLKSQLNPTSLKYWIHGRSKNPIKESKVKGKNSIKFASYHKPL